MDRNRYAASTLPPESPRFPERFDPAKLVSFTIDALGRHASQTIGSNPTTTYAYLGTSTSISSSVASGALSAYSAIDAIGDRLTSGTSGGFAYLGVDLHGNVVAAMASGSTPTYLSAYRYDAYGETCEAWNATGNTIAVPWRFQGRILESASGATDLYDFGARSYDPSLGTFTSFDSVSGSAQNPLTLNRYLYALANPASMRDPDGHSSCYDSNTHTVVECAGSSANSSGSTSSGRRSPASATYHPCTISSGNYNACGNNYNAWLDDMAANQSQNCTIDSSDFDKCYNQAGLGTTHWTEAEALIGQLMLSASLLGPPRPQVWAGAASGQGRPECQGNWLCNINNAIGTAGDVMGPHMGPAVVTLAAYMCIAGALETVGAACLPLLGVGVYTGVNAGNNALEGKPAGDNWNWIDALTAGVAAPLMLLAPEASGAAVALGFGLGLGQDVVSQLAQNHGQINWNHAFCAGAGGAYAAGPAFSGGALSKAAKGAAWSAFTSFSGLKLCEGQ